MRRHVNPRSRRGVSEIVGALLIIALAISIIASLSYFLSIAQKQAATRSDYLTGVQDEDLQIVDAQFSQNSHTDQWGSVTLKIRNLSTEGSGLDAISVNGSGVQEWEEVSPSVLLGPAYNAVALLIPPKASVNIEFNFSGKDFPYPNLPSMSNPLSIVLESSVGNFFTTLYSPPTAVEKATTTTENSQGISRDVITLDGSQSSAASSSVQSYLWLLKVPLLTSAENPDGCTVSAFTNSSYVDTVNETGETFQYQPQTTFSPTTDCIDGPIEATLTVTDQYGFNSTSQPLIIPADPNIDPVGSISLYREADNTCTTNCTATVVLQVHDVFGNLVNGTVVNAVPIYGNVTTSPLSAMTATTTYGKGTAIFTVTWPTGTTGTVGAVDFETGTLLPVRVSFP
jgi:hypothetical protein